MLRARATRSAVVGLALILAAGLVPGFALAATPQAPVTLQFYMGSDTPTQVDAEPWAVVIIDGQQASLAALHPGLVVDIVVDSLGRAIEIVGSDRTVTGPVTGVHVSNSGQLYLTIDGRSYEARLASSVVAQGGAVIGGLVANQSLLTGNVVTAHLGPYGRVGYVDIH